MFRRKQKEAGPSSVLSGLGQVLGTAPTSLSKPKGHNKVVTIDPKLDEAAAKERRKWARARRKAKSLVVFDRIEESVDEGSVLLDISEMNLTEVPPETSRMRNIQTLVAYKNPFTSLHNLSFFRSLEVLNLSKCGLTTLVDIGLSGVPFLRKLDVSRNVLTRLNSTDLANMAFLDVLNASRNKLTSLDQEVGELKILSHLDLSYNNITLTVPEEIICSLTKLECLDLTGNAELDPEKMGRRTRELHEKRLLFSSKTMRRGFVKQALGVYAEVLIRERDHIQSSQQEDTED